MHIENYQLNRTGPLLGTSLFGTQQQQSGQFSAPIGQTSAFGNTGSTGGLYNNLNQPQPTMTFPNMGMSTSRTPSSGFLHDNSMNQTIPSFGAPAPGSTTSRFGYAPNSTLSPNFGNGFGSTSMQ